MPSYKNDPIIVRTTKASGPENYNGGIYGESTLFNGVRGVTYAPGHGATVGISENATNQGGPGVYGESRKGSGVHGVGHFNRPAVVGINDWDPRKRGPHTRAAPLGAGGNGGWFESARGEGVRGWSHNSSHGGVVGVNTGNGIGVYGKGRIAGFFEGDVEVTGDIRLLSGNDCAEDFDIAELVEPGTVMVLADEGVLRQCHQAYDKRVAGVISGAGSYKPGIILGKHEPSAKRQPVGLLGKVYCKVDAQSSPIEIGDLLTTSSTPGHAMKASDQVKAFGAVIGKALRPLKEGLGLIPILIALQ